MRWLVLSLVLFFSFSLASASTEACSLSVSLINQDPYPAVPGEYVKLVFQIDGVQDPKCGDITFELLEKYPIIFDPNETKVVSLKSGTFAKDYSSHVIVPYKVRVDAAALKGNNPIEVKFSTVGSTSSFLSKNFNLYVEDVRAKFEVYVRDFNFNTNKINLEILNIGESDVEAVTVEVIQEENVLVKGPRNRIIGDLDSNEYTTTEFEIEPKETQINLNVHYTDSTGQRRTTQESVYFSPSDFENRKADQKQSSPLSWIIPLLIIAGIVYWIYKRKKKRN